MSSYDPRYSREDPIDAWYFQLTDEEKETWEKNPNTKVMWKYVRDNQLPADSTGKKWLAMRHNATHFRNRNKTTEVRMLLLPEFSDLGDILQPKFGDEQNFLTPDKMTQERKD